MLTRENRSSLQKIYEINTLYRQEAELRTVVTRFQLADFKEIE
jgi:hypothetical protein